MVDGSATALQVLGGNRRSIARAISAGEDADAGSIELLKEIFPHTGNAAVVGITGAPGAGKSTLVDRLAAFYRAGDDKVGIIAVDPSSPFTGGAILGDRIRMQNLSTDPGIFIRSMAARGTPAGLARSTADALSILAEDTVTDSKAGAVKADAGCVRANRAQLDTRRSSLSELRIREIFRAGLLRMALDGAVSQRELDNMARLVAEKRRDPYSVVDEII